jgi:hypothetical protein
MSNDQHPDEDIDLPSPWTGRLQIAGLILGIAAWALGATIAIGVTFGDSGRGQVGEVVHGVALVYGALPLTTLGATLILSLAHFAYDLVAPTGKSLALAPAILLSLAALLESSALGAGSHLLQGLEVALAGLAAGLHIIGMIIVVGTLFFGSDD